MAMSGDCFGCQNWGLLLASTNRMQSPGMLLNILRCTGQPPQQSIIQPQMSTLPSANQCHAWLRLGPSNLQAGLSSSTIGSRSQFVLREAKRQGNTVPLGTTRGPSVVLSTGRVSRPLHKSFTIPIVQVRKLRLRKCKSLARKRES